MNTGTDHAMSHSSGANDSFHPEGGASGHPAHFSFSHFPGAGFGKSHQHFTLTSNQREAGGFIVYNDSALDPQADARKRFIKSVPLKDADGKPINEYVVHVKCSGLYALQHTIRKMARNMQLVLLDKRPNKDPVDFVVNMLRSWDGWSETDTGVRPDNYYLNADGSQATGTTSLFRTYYQIGTIKGMFGKPEFDVHAHTYVEFTAVIWRYYETGDYEVLFTARVAFEPEWNVRAQAWAYRKEPFELHQRLAIQTCASILSDLSQCPPSPQSVQLRKDVLPSDKPLAHEIEGMRQITAAEERQRELDAVKVEAGKDIQTATDDTTIGAVTSDGTTPADNSDDGDIDVWLDD
jgi:hypothetical protein